MPNPRARVSLRMLVVGIALLAVVPALLLTAWHTVRQLRHEADRTQHRLSDAAGLMGRTLGAELRAASQQLRAAAGPEATPRLDALPGWRGGFRLDAQGAPLGAADGPTPPRPGPPDPGRGFFVGGAQPGAGATVHALAVPVGDGWVGAWIDTRRWQALLAAAAAAQPVGFALVDGRGEPVVAAPPPGEHPGSDTATPVPDGPATARAPVPGSDWEVVALQPAAARDARRSEVVAAGVLQALLALLGAAGVAAIAARRFADRGPPPQTAPDRPASADAAVQAAESGTAVARRARHELLTLLDHDLRNLLNTLLAAIEVMGLPNADEAARRDARATVARQTRRLNRLLHDLKTTADGAAGPDAARPAPADLAAAAHRALDVLQQRWIEDLPAGAGAGAVSPALLVRATAVVWADADAAQVEQIVAAAVDHVRRALPPEEEIAVDVFEADGRAVLEVHAAAEPAPLAAEWHGVCDPPAPAPAPARRRCGLALTLAADLAQRWRGALLSTPPAAPGHGPRLRLELPRAAGPARAPVDLARAVGAARRAAASVRTVLIIGHDPAERQVLQGLLVSAGHQVDTATDGAAGLRALLQQRPEVALVDIGLHEIDGLQLARLSRGAGYGGRLVAMRRGGDAADLRQARRAGFDALLDRPVDADQLRAAVAASS